MQLLTSKLTLVVVLLALMAGGFFWLHLQSVELMRSASKRRELTTVLEDATTAKRDLRMLSAQHKSTRLELTAALEDATTAKRDLRVLGAQRTSTQLELRAALEDATTAKQGCSVHSAQYDSTRLELTAGLLDSGEGLQMPVLGISPLEEHDNHSGCAAYDSPCPPNLLVLTNITITAGICLAPQDYDQWTMWQEQPRPGIRYVRRPCWHGNLDWDWSTQLP